MVCSANRRINNVYCRNDAVYSFCWCYIDCSEHAIDDVASLLQLEWLLNLRLFMTSPHLHLMKDRYNTKSMQHCKNHGRTFEASYTRRPSPSA